MISRRILHAVVLSLAAGVWISSYAQAPTSDQGESASDGHDAQLLAPATSGPTSKQLENKLEEVQAATDIDDATKTKLSSNRRRLRESVRPYIGAAPSGPV